MPASGNSPAFLMWGGCVELFHKRTKTQAIPDGFSASDIRTESSTCTGETVIGFYDAAKKRLCYAELVQSDADAAFYRKYGIKR